MGNDWQKILKSLIQFEHHKYDDQGTVGALGLESEKGASPLLPSMGLGNVVSSKLEFVAKPSHSIFFRVCGTMKRILGHRNA